MRRALLAALLGAVGISLAALTQGSAASLGLASQVLTPYRTCVITATPSTTTAVIDASVRQGSATSNFGTSTTNNVASALAANRRLYVLFDLTQCRPAIAPTATIRLATLRLYLTGLPTSCRTYDLFRVTSAWIESTITWNNQPFGAAINNPASGTATDAFTAGTPAGCQNLATGSYLVGANPTADVAAFVAGTATNFGWMLRDDAEGSTTSQTQTSSAKDLGILAQAPQLIVTYVAVP
jgi:hypothetical protein